MRLVCSHERSQGRASLRAHSPTMRGAGTGGMMGRGSASRGSLPKVRAKRGRGARGGRALWDGTRAVEAKIGATAHPAGWKAAPPGHRDTLQHAGFAASQPARPADWPAAPPVATRLRCAQRRQLAAARQHFARAAACPAHHRHPPPLPSHPEREQRASASASLHCSAAAMLAPAAVCPYYYQHHPAAERPSAPRRAVMWQSTASGALSMSAAAGRTPKR